MLPFRVILIGPIRAGKSTLSKSLAERLNLPRRSMDEISLSYYKEIGYDTELAKRLYENEGFLRHTAIGSHLKKKEMKVNNRREHRKFEGVRWLWSQ